MVNTNGVRLAEDEAFVERLASYLPGFEVYLQFDSFKREALLDLRELTCAAFVSKRSIISTGTRYRPPSSSP
jgi:uncharacterized radical SAM superfamily Fe-S cluster-containing enzyme